MVDFTKLAAYFDSFKKDDPNYDLVCYIKEKIATDLQDTQTINNGAEDDLTDNDITMATPEQQAAENQEGAIMGNAFKELDVLNSLQKEKEEVHHPVNRENDVGKNMEVATQEAFGDNALNQKHASLFDVLRNRLRK